MCGATTMFASRAGSVERAIRVDAPGVFCTTPSQVRYGPTRGHVTPIRPEKDPMRAVESHEAFVGMLVS